jgi:NADPH-dependent 2,4-dienoyl-CoA reductase/sulfur reductase-like enzyme
VDRKLAGFSDISCFHNPEVLRETELVLTPALKRRRIVIVGAGPAGLKAAETAAKRGHEVLLFDERRVVGGALRAVEQTAAATLLASVDHLLAELSYTDAQVRLGTTVDAAMLRELNPDEVLLATGTTPKSVEELFPGSEVTARVLSSVQAMSAGDVGGDVLVYDAVGTNEAALVAEALALRGARVVFATRYETVTPYGGQMHRWVVPDVLRLRMDSIYLSAQIGYVDGEVALLVRDDGSTIAEVKAPTIVAVMPGTPRLDLIESLDGSGIAYRVLGDAVAPRTAWNAFSEGETVALTV